MRRLLLHFHERVFELLLRVVIHDIHVTDRLRLWPLALQLLHADHRAEERDVAVATKVDLLCFQLLFDELGDIDAEAPHGQLEFHTATDEVKIHHRFRPVLLSRQVERGLGLLHELGAQLLALDTRGVVEAGRLIGAAALILQLTRLSVVKRRSLLLFRLLPLTFLFGLLICRQVTTVLADARSVRPAHVVCVAGQANVLCLRAAQLFRAGIFLQ